MGGREIGRTSANGQKAYGNDPDNEKPPARGGESETEQKRGEDECDKVVARRERGKLSSRPAAFGSNGVQMKNGDEIIRQGD